MRLLHKTKLEKLKRKNKGNALLWKAIDKLIKDFEDNNWKNQIELSESRSDADCMHSEGFYFFNLSVHRTMIMIEFDDNEATVVWVGDHQDYDTLFRGNKSTIRKWLKSNSWI